MKVFTIRDSKAEAYLNPFCASNPAVAVRMIATTAQDQGSFLYKYPSDYELFLIGEFNEQKGTISGTMHVAIGKVVDFLSKEMKFEESK